MLSSKDALKAFFNHFNEVCPYCGLNYMIVTKYRNPQLLTQCQICVLKEPLVHEHIRDSDDWRWMQRTNPGDLYDRCSCEMDRVIVEGVGVSAEY
jgi:hypothetical protein